MNLIQLTERVKLVDVNTLLLSMEGTRDDEIMTIADVSRTLTQGTGVCNVVAAGGAEPTSGPCTVIIFADSGKSS